MSTSPGDSSGASWSIIESTAAPAVTISRMRRGRSSICTNSASEPVPFISGCPYFA